MKKPILMFVTPYSGNRQKGGRESLSGIHVGILKELFQDKLTIHELRPAQENNNPMMSMMGYLDGLSSQEISSIVDKLQKREINKVFIDGSNLGLLSKEIKAKLPEVEVIIFFHNVESRFFLGSLRQQKTLKSIFVMLANYIAERWAVKSSDVRVMLNQRDSHLLKRIYGKSATHILPMIVPDIRKAPRKMNKSIDGEKYALFVGGAFYANVSGIEWYAREVSPKINIKTIVVGRGWEEFEDRLKCYDNVEVVGEVDDLVPWYENCAFVVAPIFDGSGMKTKVAEAMMFGKKIIGTSEAFCGYEDFIFPAGKLCATAEEFIEASNVYSDVKNHGKNNDLVKIYEDNYSLHSAKIRIEKILGMCR